jgi:hypothetical protein
LLNLPEGCGPMGAGDELLHWVEHFSLDYENGLIGAFSYILSHSYGQFYIIQLLN